MRGPWVAVGPFVEAPVPTTQPPPPRSMQGGDLPKKAAPKRNGAVAASARPTSMPLALLRAVLLPLIILAIALLFVLR